MWRPDGTESQVNDGTRGGLHEAGICGTEPNCSRRGCARGTCVDWRSGGCGNAVCQRMGQPRPDWACKGVAMRRDRSRGAQAVPAAKTRTRCWPMGGWSGEHTEKGGRGATLWQRGSCGDVWRRRELVRIEAARRPIRWLVTECAVSATIPRPRRARLTGPESRIRTHAGRALRQRNGDRWLSCPRGGSSASVWVAGAGAAIDRGGRWASQKNRQAPRCAHARHLPSLAVAELRGSVRRVASFVFLSTSDPVRRRCSGEEEVPPRYTLSTSPAPDTHKYTAHCVSLWPVWADAAGLAASLTACSSCWFAHSHYPCRQSADWIDCAMASTSLIWSRDKRPHATPCRRRPRRYHEDITHHQAILRS
jgi:hypothetical protein